MFWLIGIMLLMIVPALVGVRVWLQLRAESRPVADQGQRDDGLATHS